jgi:hypothetical protein
LGKPFARQRIAELKVSRALNAVNIIATANVLPVAAAFSNHALRELDCGAFLAWKSSKLAFKTVKKGVKAFQRQ